MWIWIQVSKHCIRSHHYMKNSTVNVLVHLLSRSGSRAASTWILLGVMYGAERSQCLPLFCFIFLFLYFFLPLHLENRVKELAVEKLSESVGVGARRPINPQQPWRRRARRSGAQSSDQSEAAALRRRNGGRQLLIACDGELIWKGWSRVARRGAPVIFVCLTSRPATSW